MLRDLVVEFGSVVDKGANPGADIVLFKRDASADDTATEATIAAAVVNDTLEKVGRKMSGPRLNALKAAVEHLNRILGEVDSSSADEDDEKEEAHMAKSETTPVEAPKVEKAAEPVVDVSKDDAIAKMQAELETLRKRAEDAETLAKAEREERLVREWIEKARAYAALPTTADKLGPVLKRAHAALPAEDFAELERLFAAAHEHMTKAAVYRDLGQSGETGSESAMAKLNKRASEMVSAGEAKHYADAIDKISRDPANRDLIEAWNRERH